MWIHLAAKRTSCIAAAEKLGLLAVAWCCDFRHLYANCHTKHHVYILTNTELIVLYFIQVFFFQVLPPTIANYLHSPN